MLSGNNGILQQSTTAKDNTEKEKIIEIAQMDILGKQTENHGSLSADELEEILISPDYNTQGTLSNEESILERTLTSSNGKYQIPVSEIYNGTLNSTNPNIPTDYNNEVKTALVEGKYVTYKNKPYVVLYNDDNGIEIIAMETVGTVTLGENDETEGAQGTKGEISRAQWSYNNAIETLNKTVEDLFPRDRIIDDARCVGSVPGKTNGISNKNTKNSTPYVHGSYNNYFSSYDNQFEQGECSNDRTNSNGYSYIEDSANYKSDYNKMQTLGILGCNGCDYWIASRFSGASESHEGTNDACTTFGLNLVQHISFPGYEGDTMNIYVLIYRYEDRWLLSENELQLRPVLHLAYTAKIKNDGGDGTSTQPFVLE